MNGCVHIYCGDGKGKTSAAIGLAIRAAGRGKTVLFARFLKTEDSGEVEMLRSIPGITVPACGRSFGFTFRMTQEQKKEAAAYYRRRFDEVCEEAVRGRYDILILDELLGACSSAMVEEGRVTAFLESRPGYLEVIMTGRDPSERLVGMADYVSEICMVRHPYQKGIAAREGIEY